MTSEDELNSIPPTSTQSFPHLTTFTTLCENKPGDGTSPLASLNPTVPTSRDPRPPPIDTTTRPEGTITDVTPVLLGCQPAISTMTTSASSAMEAPNLHCQGYNDSTFINPAPFRFKPDYLVSLVDAKNLGHLEAIGGIVGLTTGLNVDPTCGLCIGGGAPQFEEAPVATIVRPAGGKGDGVEQHTYEGPPFSGTIEDRQRVYGPDVLPVRKSRSFLESMLLGFQDRVLVSPTRFPQSSE